MKKKIQKEQEQTIAPDNQIFSIETKFSLLTEENKQRVNRQIEILIASQS